MKSFKEFAGSIVIEEDKKESQPPNILIMKRKSIRQFSNGQKVALYYIDKLNKYITVPYTDMQLSSTIESD